VYESKYPSFSPAYPVAQSSLPASPAGGSLLSVLSARSICLANALELWQFPASFVLSFYSIMQVENTEGIFIFDNQFSSEYSMFSSTWWTLVDQKSSSAWAVDFPGHQFHWMQTAMLIPSTECCSCLTPE
jgi:hypothetical protein